MLRTILIGILILMILVVIHEFGHFTAARKSGVKVLEFGIGIPPKIKKFHTDKKGTNYTINAIPLGGFVQLKGEDPEQEGSLTDKDSMMNANMFKKTIIILAGIISNILLAWILFAITFMIGTKPLQIVPDSMMKEPIESYLMPSESFALEKGIITKDDNADNQVQIVGVQEGSLAHQIGLSGNDIISAINDTTVTTDSLGATLQKNIGKQNTITYLRGDKEITKDFTCPEDTCMLGVLIHSNIQTNTIQAGFFKSFAMSAEEIWGQTKLTFSALGTIGNKLFSGDKEKIKESTDGLAGPVGAIKVGETFAQTNGFAGILAFMAMISLALAIFNLLPIPALDGGRLLGMWIQYIFNIPKEKYFKVEGYINFVFFMLLLILGVFIILQDLSRFRNVSIPFVG